MKIESLFKALLGIIVVAVCMSCGTDEPVVDSEDVFIPYTGPIEPLSQDIRPTITDGKRWVYKNFYTKGVEPFINIDYIGGDTIFEGHNGEVISGKILCSSAVSWDGQMFVPVKKAKVVKEEGGIVYSFWCEGIRFDDIGFKYEYDVNPQSGMIVNANVKILGRGIITLMGKERRAAKVMKYIWYPEGKTENIDYWVEGIGSLFGMIPDYTQVINSQPQFLYAQLLQCYDGDEKIYDYREFSHDLYQPIEEFSYDNQ